MTWDRMPSISTYPKARRRELFRRMGNILTGHEPQSLLNLEDVQQQLDSYQQSYLGVRSIPVESIIGTVSRSHDFDDAFLPRRRVGEKRWEAVERVFADGAFPPISVYKVGDAYFVSDGHHRVAIARQRKVEFIDADIIEVHTPYEITADTDVADLVHLGQQRLFMQESGLADVMPAARFAFTRPEGYRELLDNLKVHGWDLVVGREEYVSKHEIALHWYTEVYLPTAEHLRRAGLADLIGDVTIDDLFLWVTERWRRLFPDRGPLTFEEIIDEAAQEQADKLTTKAKIAVDKVEGAIDEVVGKVRNRPDSTRTPSDAPGTAAEGPASNDGS